jgi:2-dehydropantoate 2-reductase
MNANKDNLTAVVGAGALGVMYAEQIHRSRLPVAFVADELRRSPLEEDGVRVNDTVVRVPVIGWDHPPVARIIVAVKHQHLPDVCSRIGRIADGDTLVISVMNGIESEGYLQKALDEGAGGLVLPAMAAGMDAVRTDAGVSYTRTGTIYFGAPPDRAGPDAESSVNSLKDFFDQAGIACIVPADIVHALWNKFMLNVGINQWSAVLRAPYRVFHHEGPGRTLMRSAMEEVLLIAQARGIPLTGDDLEKWFTVVEQLSAPGKTSMLQDVEARRKTEVEMFAGRVVAMGSELGIATPVNQTLLDALIVVEELYREV